ncbi:MAG: cation acetate symporter, partial [Lentisphaeria bacterium]|nr:cation acetate symporter [Lentisphaeria bacterium]
FLYSIGYLAGWIVALFVVAEPMKRLGKYTFTDALDSKFNSKGIQLVAAISTLVVSIFYLIPQMVGAGVLVQPLLGLSHAAGVVMVGVIVVIIVATAGMASTTYVQFLKGALLIVFSVVITVAMCVRGLSTTPDQGGQVPFHEPAVLQASMAGHSLALEDASYTVSSYLPDQHVAKLSQGGVESWWGVSATGAAGVQLTEAQWMYTQPDGTVMINGKPESKGNHLRQVGNLTKICGKTGEAAKTGALSPAGFLSAISDKDTIVRVSKKLKIKDGQTEVSVFTFIDTPGNKFMRPGMKFKVEGNWSDKLNFISLMLALFCGTAALPHILIRYYTVPSPACARKSTILAIAAIGFFYVLTLFLGLGATVNGVLNPLSSNMSAPLLARSFGTLLFAIVSAIAFATVLGTVSGLIVASSGAVAHDLIDRFGGVKMTDERKVLTGKIAAVCVGIIAIFLGIKFKGQNVSFLVGWAFSVAASANLPAIIMLLFWKKTTAKGIVASIIVGMVSALGIILISPDMYKIYGMNPADSMISLNQPGIVSIPLSFLTLVVVSLLTQKSLKKTV